MASVNALEHTALIANAQSAFSPHRSARCRLVSVAQTKPQVKLTERPAERSCRGRSGNDIP